MAELAAVRRDGRPSPQSGSYLHSFLALDHLVQN